MRRTPAIMVLALATAAMSAPAQAEEHGRPLPVPQSPPAESSGPDGKGTPQDHTGTRTRGSTGWTGGSREQRQNGEGVGSRALEGDQKGLAADQPEMATGADLKGPPVRFAPDNTPE